MPSHSSDEPLEHLLVGVGQPAGPRSQLEPDGRDLSPIVPIGRRNARPNGGLPPGEARRLPAQRSRPREQHLEECPDDQNGDDDGPENQHWRHDRKPPHRHRSVPPVARRGRGGRQTGRASTPPAFQAEHRPPQLAAPVPFGTERGRSMSSLAMPRITGRRCCGRSRSAYPTRRNRGSGSCQSRDSLTERYAGRGRITSTEQCV
jgi:hypothetical protein